jgi:cobalt-zinc-cadmium efflux system protein
MEEEHGHDHVHGHDHDHGLSARKGNTRPLFIALAITASFAIIELLGAFISGSLALLSDSGHMFTDVLALALSLGAAYMASREATESRTFGLLRVEILVALVNGAVLVVLSFVLIYEAFDRLADPHPVEGQVMLLIAMMGLVANIIGIWLLHGGSKENLNVRGAFLHMMGDLLSSIGVIVAAGIIIIFGWTQADPIISIVIGCVILYNAFSLVRQSGSILLEFAPPHVTAEQIREELLKLDGVLEVHDIHMWTLTSGVYNISLHLVVEDQMVSACSCLREEAEHLLEEKFRFAHTTIQMESETCQAGECYFNSKK